jgi:Flp pilus assembly protein TadD
MSVVLDRAIAHHRRGELAQAEALYRKILKACPREPDPLHLLGCIELKRNRRASAIRLMKKAVELAPETPLYHENLAEAFHRDGQVAAAEAECRLALRADPNRPAALNRLGVMAMERGDYDEARARLSEALKVNPVYTEALVNLGAVLTRSGDFELARESCELALRVEPKHPLAWNNLGLALKGMGRRAEAAEAFMKAEALPMARYNLGYLRLLEDDLETGLPLCETRKLLVDPGRGLKKREWDGRPFPKGRLLVVHEQGMGDTILMSRFFPRLRDHFSEVTVLVQKPLVRLLADLDPRIAVVSDAAGVRYDRWAATMSLPYLLGLRSADQIPVEPWIRVPAPPRRCGRLRVGVNWAGNPSFHFDRSRSMSLDALSGLLAVPQVEWVSLHKGNREDEAERHGLPQPLRDARDFHDTTRVIAGLDLVISTETAVPNLSAAMGVPTCVLAAVDHDWRWRTWFSGVTVCAQDALGHWPGAVARAADVVRRLVESRVNVGPAGSAE